ncbi:MAG TPA: ABC transporter permease [Verrucomicrobiae bacterium]|nr:ABC transporter permease [Verrucomicrobiae bacterium]
MTFQMPKFLRGFRAILYKEFIVIFRDRTTLFFMFFPPLLQIIAFGFALDNDVKHMAMAVYDEDRTTDSRQLVDAFVNTQTFRVVKRVDSLAELESMVRRGKAYAGLEIPPDFTRKLHAGQKADVQVLIDGSNSTTALQALNTAVGVALQQSVGILLGETSRRELPVEVRPQVLYNPSMRAPNFFVPGVIGTALQIATVFAAAMSIVRERERGTLEQLLVSPMSRWGLMLGKIVPYLCVSMTMATFLFVILRWVFFIPIRGSLLMLFGAAFLYIFALLSLGLLVSTVAQSQNEALQMSMTVLLPSIFFSGFIFPRETMPWIFYALSTILPATYFIELMRAIILRGASFSEFWRHLLILAVMGGVLFSLCALRFKRKIA